MYPSLGLKAERAIRRVTIRLKPRTVVRGTKRRVHHALRNEKSIPRSDHKVASVFLSIPRYSARINIQSPVESGESDGNRINV